jgi:hypothetical protein
MDQTLGKLKTLFEEVESTFKESERVRQTKPLSNFYLAAAIEAHRKAINTYPEQLRTAKREKDSLGVF